MTIYTVTPDYPGLDGDLRQQIKRRIRERAAAQQRQAETVRIARRDGESQRG